MPPFWQLIDEPGADVDANLSRLFAAVNVAVQDYCADVDALLHSGAASTAQDPFLPRWEELYGTTIKDEQTLPDRRSAVTAKMRGGGICTPEKLANIVASFAGTEIAVIEHYEIGKVEICFTDQRHAPSFLDDLTIALQASIPAHLSITYSWSYLKLQDVESMTLSGIETKTLDQFAGG